ncbi:hypothetical protein SAMN05421543_1234 [Alicyclobacillus macrosporangiidus]|uniref:Uncharacterized protein n=1 Tax=Alicyclobacillus macrosporangiidus TaxID=392015 RepID=A0A1I7L249_9BACL|nr:hypothetical protein SAMN05421543_1234 [Alicyclobacillus macrosporangiidus]
MKAVEMREAPKTPERYLIWMQRWDGWIPTPRMTREEADALGQQLDAAGRSFRVVPAPRTTVEDLIE